MYKIQNKKIYLDNAATTPTDPRVFKAMMPYLQDKYGNSSSQHSFGQDTMKAVNKAKNQLADFLNCNVNEIIFTSGATESNNLAIQGYVRGLCGKSHIITSQIEHPSVLEVCKALEKQGIEVTYVDVNKDGLVDVENVKKAIKKNTVLISIMYVNNETGIIQPIREIGKMVKKYNKSIRVSASNPRLVFHTDATQAINYCNCNVKYLHVDMLSLSGHKIYGPKGVGGLYVSKNIKLLPINYGGHQENGLRAGTYNTPAIVGLGKAIEIISKPASAENKKIAGLRDKIIKEVTKKLPDIHINGSLDNRIPSNINLSFKDVDGESVMIMLDMEGIAVSTGSACSSGSTEPSHVLMAMGISHRLAESSIRITLGKYNTAKEINSSINKLVNVIKKLRKVSP
ncbi:cysteine desulfurase family protein [Patescibacteria group bacterium]